MPDYFALELEIKRKAKAATERAWLEKLCDTTLNDQEAFEAKQDLLGAFSWLVEMDRKYNPKLYEDQRD